MWHGKRPGCPGFGTTLPAGSRHRRQASPKQIENAFPHPSIRYRIEPAENTSIEPGSVDLITAGTAIHWFDFGSFYGEVRRVGKPGAVLAVWTYHFLVVNPAVDAVLARFYWQTLDVFWPERIHFLEEHYQTLPFPFEEIEPPAFQMQANWGLGDLVGFINSWSATQNISSKQASILWTISLMI
ncbi:MAG: methyltransferase domain-containing protein [Anaerolineales bacterium]